MVLFKSGDITLTSWYLFLFCYFLYIEGLSIDENVPEIKKDVNYLVDVKQWSLLIIALIIYNFNSILCGFGELFIYLVFKKDEKKYYPKLLNITTSKAVLDNEKKEKWLLLLLYIGLGVVDTISSGMFFFRNFMLPDEFPNYIDIIIKGLLVAFTSFFSYLILNTSFDMHKIVGIGIIFFGLIIGSITSGVIEKGNNFNYYIVLAKVVSNLGQGFQEVFEKYMLHFKYQSPYMILLYEGIIDNIILGICLAIIQICTGFQSFPLDWLKESIYKLVRMPFYCVGYNLIRILINRNTTPTHRVIGDNFHSLLTHIIKAFTKGINNITLFILLLIGYMIASLGGIIYNEMILIEAFNLANDTKKQIDQRAIDEVKDYQKILAENPNSSIEINDISNDSNNIDLNSLPKGEDVLIK